MLITAVGLFFLAALLGLLMLVYVLNEKKPPRIVVFTHGPLALTGIVLLIIYAITNARTPLVSIVLFILAALGGATLLYKDLSGNKIPGAIAIIHGFVALIAFVFLLFFTFT